MHTLFHLKAWKMDVVYVFLDRSIKLWKLCNKRMEKALGSDACISQESDAIDTPESQGLSLSASYKMNNNSSNSNTASIKIPHIEYGDLVTIPSLKRSYSSAHAYHINSLSVNADGQTFLSSDDLKINFWHLEDPERCFSKKNCHIDVLACS